MDMLYKVMIDDTIRVDCLGDEHLNLKVNDGAIIDHDRYQDYGRVITVGELDAERVDLAELPRITRHATLVDQGKAHENQVRSKSMHRAAEECIAARQLPMRLVTCHFSFDRRLAIFIFTAPGRVDFRELLKDLNRRLNTRVELRQIGPRDQAGMIGGMAACGRPLCCSSWMSSFVSINVKMAKAQGLSLNPSNIIGACGRLRCCLNYELEGYQQLMRALPRPGGHCFYEGEEGRVIDVNPLLQTVRLSLDHGDRVMTVSAGDIEPMRGRGRQR